MNSLPSSSLMKSWQIMQYVKSSAAVASELHLTETRRIPTIRNADQILVKVHAASLNPIDLHQMKGYGRTSFRTATSTISCLSHDSSKDLEFPLTVGRDFCGEIVIAGPEAQKKGFQLGQLVCGATFPHQSMQGSGAFAQYLVTPTFNVVEMPKSNKNISEEQAAGVMYAGLTAWAALEDSGGFLIAPNAQCNRRVLIVGATGGLGFVAAQLAGITGASVDVIIPESSDAQAMMDLIKVDNVYKRPELPDSDSRYDVILDCVRPDKLSGVNDSLHKLLDEHQPGVYINLNSPALDNIDKGGLVCGAIDTIRQIACANQRSIIDGRGVQVRWAFFRPNQSRMAKLLQWMSGGDLVVQVQEVFNFDQIPLAFDRLEQGGTRGKLVVKY